MKVATPTVRLRRRKFVYRRRDPEPVLRRLRRAEYIKAWWRRKQEARLTR